MKSILIKRNPKLDNAKYLLIVIVVFGHLIELLINKNTLLKAIYLSIYSFHMPLFILIAGMLTKIIYSEKQINKTISGILIPFILFTILYEILNLFIYGNLSNYTLNFQPYWILWFLFSLFIYKILLPIIIKFKFPVLLSIITSLLAGYINSIGYSFGISRTLYFFPFFIIGYIYLDSLLLKLNKIPKKYYIIIIFLNIIFFYYMRDMPHQWLYGSYSYGRLDMKEWFSWLIRLSFYIISFITSISVLMIIPDKELFFTKFGINSLYVYLWHGFFIKFISALGLIILIKSLPSFALIIVIFLIALIISSFLSLTFIKNFTYNMLIKPIERILLK